MSTNRPVPQANQSNTLLRRDAGAWCGFLAAQRRQRQKLAYELGQVRGLLPLLMRRRNGGAWSQAERTELTWRLRELSHLSPYLIALALPGSILALPLLAWWLDRRATRRSPWLQLNQQHDADQQQNRNFVEPAVVHVAVAIAPEAEIAQQLAAEQVIGDQQHH